MKIKNKEAEAYVPKISAGRFTVIMKGLPKKQLVSFEDVREAEGKTATQLSDGEIHQAALDAGFEVEL